jgi:hypothetical protein
MVTKLRERFRAFFPAQAPAAPPEELQFLDAVVHPFLNDIQAAYELAARLQQEVTALRNENTILRQALAERREH